MTHLPSLLLTEVEVAGTVYVMEIPTDTIWRISAAEALEEVRNPSHELRAGMRAERRRRYLDALVDEAELLDDCKRAWGRMCDVTALNIEECGADKQASVPARPLRAEVESTTRTHAPMWCDVESLPPRTLDLSAEPTVTYDQDVVGVQVAAFGPPGRRPHATTVLARFWSTAAESSLATFFLCYDPCTHTFQGQDLTPFRADFVNWHHPDSGLFLDISATYQAQPMPRDADHDKAWQQWQTVNQRWITEDQSLVPSPAIVPGHRLPLVRLSHRGRWMIVDPFGANGDAGVPVEGAAAWRRLGVIAFFTFAKQHLNRAEGRALTVDRALARASLGLATQEELDAAEEHLFTLATRSLRSENPLLRNRMAEKCRAFVAGGRSSARLSRLAHELHSEFAPIEPALRIRAGHEVRDAAQVWLLIRQDAAEGRPPGAFRALLMREVSEGLRKRLQDYRPVGDSDEPLIAELLRMIPSE